MKLWPDNTSHHLKDVYDILTGYFYQSLMKSLSQHIWKRLYKNALKTQEISFTRLTSTVFPPTSKAGNPARSAILLTGRPRAAYTQESKEILSSPPTAGQGPRAAHSEASTSPARGARSAKRLTCIYIYGILYAFLCVIWWYMITIIGIYQYTIIVYY